MTGPVADRDEARSRRLVGENGSAEEVGGGRQHALVVRGRED